MKRIYPEHLITWGGIAVAIAANAFAFGVVYQKICGRLDRADEMISDARMSLKVIRDDFRGYRECNSAEHETIRTALSVHMGKAIQ